MLQNQGIEVWLRQGDKRRVEEISVTDGQDFGEDAGRTPKARTCYISQRTGLSFAVRIKFGRDFQLFGAQGIQLSVAIGNKAQKPSSMDDVQTWFFPAKAIQRSMVEDSSFTITGWQTWSGGTMKRQPFLFPPAAGKCAEKP